MPTHRRKTRSHLFTVRVWSEDVDEGSVEWRGKVQCVATGETLYFRDWGAMTEFVVGTLDADSPIAIIGRQETPQGGQ